jgi:peptidoglycan/LPS O-acetylase OafA/YrhL
MGVDVFFVLSGMLMSTILFDKRLSLKDFYIRRLSRVYPVLLAYVVAIYAFSWSQSLNFSASEVVSSLVFLRTYFPAEPGIWSGEVAIGHLWSLNVEEHAYVLLSLLTLLFINRKYLGLLLLGLGCGSVALGFYHYSSLPAEEFKLYLIRTESAIVFIFFSAGYGLLKRRIGWKGHPMLTVMCLLGALLCYAQAMPIWLVFSISPILLSVAVNHLDNLPKYLNWVLSLAPLRYLGIYSYSIYIWQQFFFEYSWAFPIPRLTVALLAVAVGIASYYLLENPVRQFINSRWSRNPNYQQRSKDL